MRNRGDRVENARGEMRCSASELFDGFKKEYE
jgi:hypothetical protein